MACSFQKGCALQWITVVWSCRVSCLQQELRPSVPEVVRPCRALSEHVVNVFSCSAGGATAEASALALLVTRVLADDHDAAVATNHLALVTDRLNARVDLHVSPFSSGSAAYL